MPQDINLLLKQPLLPPSLLWGGLGVVVALVAQIGYGTWLWRANAHQTAIEAKELSQLADLRGQLALRGQKSNDQTRLQVDMARLTHEANAYGPLLSLVQQGRLGLGTGYLEHLTLLARMTDSRVWITQVSLGNAGRTLSLQGQALDEPAVLAYRDRLNQAFGALGATFTSLDLSVTNTALPGGVASPAGSATTDQKTVSFRLN